jgi:hypothetical protein
MKVLSNCFYYCPLYLGGRFACPTLLLTDIETL